MNKIKTKNLTLLSLFIAIELLMVSIPFLGFIPIGPLRATTLHIPVIIAGIVLGKDKGAIIGLVFGLSSLIVNTVSPSAISFVFSPFISGSFFSVLLAIIPRVCIGFISGLIYESLKKKWNLFSMILASFIGSLTNTILIMSGIYYLFGDAYARIMGQSIDELLNYILGIICTQGLLEAIVGCTISVMICKVLIKIVK